MFENTPLARRQWTGLDDEHLASIGFVTFAWNALERKFASLVWATADWSQEIGEVVTTSLGNVSLVSLFLNLLKQELAKRDDRQIWAQAIETGALFDKIRGARNDMIHSFFHFDPTTNVEGYFKGSVRRSKSGQVQLKTVAMEKNDIDQLCCAMSDCLESIDDLVLKIWFRRRFLGSGRRGSAAAYEQAVHGWQEPPFDLSRLSEYSPKYSMRSSSPQQRPSATSRPRSRRRQAVVRQRPSDGDR